MLTCPTDSHPRATLVVTTHHTSTSRTSIISIGFSISSCFRLCVPSGPRHYRPLFKSYGSDDLIAIPSDPLIYHKTEIPAILCYTATLHPYPPARQALRIAGRFLSLPAPLHSPLGIAGRPHRLFNLTPLSWPALIWILIQDRPLVDAVAKGLAGSLGQEQVAAGGANGTDTSTSCVVADDPVDDPNSQHRRRGSPT